MANRRGNNGNGDRFYFLGLQNYCGWWLHEIKRCLLLGRKAVTNLDSIINSRNITLPTKAHIVKAMVFPVVLYRCQTWIIKKTECQRIDAFKMWCWRRHLIVPWTARRSNQSIYKEINPEYSWKNWCWSWSSSTLATLCEEPTHSWIFLEELMLKLKLQYFGHLMRRANSLEKSWSWERLRVEGEGDYRGLDGWVASSTQWTWVWANSRRWWRTRKPGMLQSMRSQRVKDDLATEQQQNITYIVFMSCPCLHIVCLLLTIWELNKLSSCLQTHLDVLGFILFLSSIFWSFCIFLLV